MEGRKVRARSESFKDHFSQATMFWNSMSKQEKEHIISAFSFELGKVKSKDVRKQVVDMFAHVDLAMAREISGNIGVHAPEEGGSDVEKSSPALSMEDTAYSPATRKVAVLLTDGFEGEDVKNILEQLERKKMYVEIVSDKQGMIKGTKDVKVEADHTFVTADPVLFDAVYAAGGMEKSKEFDSNASYYLKEAFSHFKPIGATHEGKDLIKAQNLSAQSGVIMEASVNSFAEQFTEAVSKHRFWDRNVG
ncbi:hypothetical protein GCM10028868_08070 [Virgibacillus kimchii]